MNATVSCNRFEPNPFQPTKCKHCMHQHTIKDGVAPASVADGGATRYAGKMKVPEDQFTPYGKPPALEDEEDKETQYADLIDNYMNEFKVQGDWSSSSSESESDSEEEGKKIKHKKNAIFRFGVASDDEDEDEIDSHLLKIPRALSLFTSTYHWALRFIPITEQLQAPTTLEKRAVLLRRLAVLETEFVKTATFYGKIIIGERFLPDSKKSIIPIDIGGVAGGIKYIVEGILFKFAWDHEKVYDGDLKAIKAASHELNSLRSIYLNLPVGVFVPLMVAIDFKGFKLLAMSLLPVNKNTLVYGSSDGGKTVQASDEVVNAKMAELGRELNLKQHTAGGLESRKIFMPADIEVHKGTDSKYYMLDFSRLWPPEVPTKGMKACFLIRKLREELVRAFDRPLCSDAFSCFQTGTITEVRENAADILAAFSFLADNVIPSLTKQLEERITDPLAIQNFDITSFMHEKGVNMRHLGLVWARFKDPAWRRVALTEASFRVAKRTVQSLMRKASANITTTTDEPFHRVIVGYFNFLFGDTEESTIYWNTELRWNLVTNFFFVGDTSAALSKITDLKKSVDLERMVAMLPQALGIELRNDLMERDKPGAFFRGEVLFKTEDILSIDPVVSSGLTEHSRAFLLYHQACHRKNKTKIQTENRDSLLMQAMGIFARTARFQSSNHFLTFRYWAKSLLALSHERFKENVQRFAEFTEWMLLHVLRNPAIQLKNSATWKYEVFEFLKDYGWVLLKLQELCLPLDFNHQQQLAQLIHPLVDVDLLILYCIPSTRVVIEEALPFFIHIWEQGNIPQRSQALNEKEMERLHSIFHSLDISDRYSLGEPHFLDIANRISSLGLGSLVKDLKIKAWITDSTLKAVLIACPALENLKVNFAELENSLGNICAFAPHLRRLRLRASYSGIQDTDTHFSEWMEYLLEHLPYLRSLRLGFNFIFPRSAKLEALASHLETLEVVRTGSLLYEGFSFPNLRELIVNPCDFEEITANVNLSGMTHLRRLVLHMSSGYSYNQELLAIVTQLAEHCTEIEDFELTNVPIAAEHLTLLVGKLTKLKKIQFYSLASSSTSDEPDHDKALALLSQFPCLTHLHIEQDLYEGKAVLALIPAAGMPTPPLKSLILETREGKQEMLQVLKHYQPTLTSIKGLCWEFRDEDVEDLKKVLPPKVTHLGLESTALTIKGLKELLPSFKELQVLALSSQCQIDSVFEILPRLPSNFKMLRLGAQDLNEESAWDPVLEICKDRTLIIWNRNFGLLTCALGKEDDIINATKGFNTPLTSRFGAALRRLQALHWEGAKYFPPPSSFLT